MLSTTASAGLLEADMAWIPAKCDDLTRRNALRELQDRIGRPGCRMSLVCSLVLFLLIVLVSSTAALAQNEATAAESAAELRAQLLDLNAKEAELKVQAHEIDEALKPENIDRAFAATGSTRPEELREKRRLQLQARKANVQSQLEHLANSRTRLESALATADAAAYHQSAEGVSAPTHPQISSGTSTKKHKTKHGHPHHPHQQRHPHSVHP
jgi:uncharacterized protein YlxW (UPF0749 family)